MPVVLVFMKELAVVVRTLIDEGSMQYSLDTSRVRQDITKRGN